MSLRSAFAPLALAAGVVLAFAPGGAGSAGQARSAPSVGAPPEFEGHVVPALAAPDFALHDEDGRLVRLSAQRGHFVLLAFLYTHCQDVCPLIASNLNDALRELGPARRNVRILAVSVDPKGDTRQAVRRFLSSRHALPQFRYLIGTREELAPVWQGYDVVVDPGDLDTVEHSAFEWLIDPRGTFRIGYESTVTSEQVLHDLRLLLGKNR